MKQFFVYGTLRQGHPAHRTLMIRHAKLIGEVRLPGFDMFKLGWFPGVVKNPQNKHGIVGELYEVPGHLAEDLVTHLDYYEGYFPENKGRSLFVREEVEVEGKPTIIYTYNGGPDKFGRLVEKIETGDWKQQ